jgi:ABC-2 type transport system ATP-binding protein
MEMIKVNNLRKEFITYEKQPGLKGMIKSFFNAKKIIKTAVNDVSFHINEGEIVGYIGPNGAGKSTTIKMLTGILTPTSGEIFVNGLIPYKSRTINAKNIGVVFGQRSQLWWDLPLNESFTVLKEIYQVNDADFKERMDFFNQIFGLQEFIKQPVRQLSLGQRMKADIAASLLHNPKIIFFDEPTIGLDVIAKEKIRQTIKEINKKFKTTIILTTHDLSDIEELCNRIILIDKGKLIYDGDVDNIKERYGSKKQVKFTLKTEEDFFKVDVINEFSHVDPKINIKFEDNTLSVIFNKQLLGIKDITAYILNKLDVVDINIEEVSLESIIKEIYKDGLI